MHSWNRLLLYPPALLWGMGTGLVIVIVVVVLDRLLAPASEGFGVILFRVLLIYGPAGFVTGALVERTDDRRRQAQRYAPGAFHALLVGVALGFGHALVLLVDNGGSYGSVSNFAAEMLIVSILAAIGGGAGADLLRAVRAREVP